MQVKAGTTAVGQEELVFLDLNTDLWTPSMNAQGKKLNGRHSWPFSIELPRTVTIPDSSKGGRPSEFNLPPTFTERASPAFIDYRLVVTIKRGGFRVNQVYVHDYSNGR